MSLTTRDKLDQFVGRIKTQNNCLITLQIDLTDFCVCKCKGCEHWKWPVKTKIDKAVLDTNVLPYLEYFNSLQSVVLSGGEPLLHPDVESIVYRIRNEYGLGLGIITSGLGKANLNWEALSRDCAWIRLSTDGFTRESYASTRGVDMFDQWTCNLKTLLNENKKTGCRTRLNVTIHDYNVDNFADNLVNFLIQNEIYIDVFFWFSRDIIDRLRNEGDAYRQQMISRISVQVSRLMRHPDSDDLQLDRRLNFSNIYKHFGNRQYTYHSCFVPKMFGLISSDGNVFPCCYMYEPVFSMESQQTKFVIGNVNTQNLRQIYEGSRYLEVMNEFLVCDKKFPQCKFCDRYDHLNVYLNQLEEVKHVHIPDDPIFL